MTPVEQLKADIILAVDTARAAGVPALTISLTLGEADLRAAMPLRNVGNAAPSGALPEPAPAEPAPAD